jgi:site-specific DNA-cytosine methylase
MDRGFLPTAPIVEDVRMMGYVDSVEMLTAGFPCQDFSKMGRVRKGIAGSRSGLFSEILRILDVNMAINIVCLENSPMIYRYSIEEVVESLRKRGFICIWGTWFASEVGAPHERGRWFCLAYKNPEQMDIIRTTLRIDTVRWIDEPCPRVIPFIDAPTRKHQRTLLYALGNSIVPSQARRAFSDLAGYVLLASNLKWKPYNLRTKRTRSKRVFIHNFDRETYYIERDVTMYPYLYTKTFRHGNVEFIKRVWPTPTALQSNQARKLTFRMSGFFKIAIFYEIETIRYMGLTPSNIEYADRSWSINPAFVSYIMGYDIDWVNLAVD